MKHLLLCTRYSHLYLKAKFNRQGWHFRDLRFGA